MSFAGLHFALLESNTTGTGKLAVQRLLDDGAAVTFLARQRSKYPFLGERPGLQVCEFNTNDPRALSTTVDAVHAAHRIDALLTFSTFYVVPAAEQAARLGLPTLSAEAAATCHDKHRCRHALRRAGLATPPFWLISNDLEADRMSREFSYPCVVKPPAESGSSGVKLAANREEALAHFRLLNRRQENERGQALDGSVLVEGFIDGPEFSVETMTVGGRTRVLGVTQKYLSPAPNFVEVGHDFPAPLSSPRRRALEEATVSALEAVKYNCGPAHTEIRESARGPVVIEINPRLAGGMIPELIRLATGIDVLAAVLHCAAGRQVELEPTRQQAASIRFILAPAAGTLRAVEGLDLARGRSGVAEVSCGKGLGSAVRMATSATDRLGYVIAFGTASEEAKKIADSALQDITVQL